MIAPRGAILPVQQVLVAAGDRPTLPQADYEQCRHGTLWKNGKRHGRQQYRCALCGKQYREGARNLQRLRVEIGRDLARGLSVRAIARRTGASRQGVRYVRALLERHGARLTVHHGGRPRGLRNCADMVNS